MMGPSHRVVGVVAFVVAAPYVGITDWRYIALGALVAGIFAHGILSPDMDQAYYWTSKLIPGGHRAVTHFWLWPVIGGWVALRYVPIGWSWFALAVVIAWSSHIAGDFIFGRIPVWKRWHGWQYAGLGFKTGGFFEHLTVVALAVFGAWTVLA